MIQVYYLVRELQNQEVFFWNDFEIILETLKEFRIVASDIVELSPEIDSSGVSSIVAAKVLRSLIMSVQNMQ